MAEKEAPKIKMSIWFFLFLVYLAVSLVVIISITSKYNTLKADYEKLSKDATYSASLSTSRMKYIASRLNISIDELNKALESIEEGNNSAPVVEYTPEVIQLDNGTLTLKDETNAVIEVGEGESLTVFEGTYTRTENEISFTTYDNASSFVFIRQEDNSYICPTL